MGEKRGRQFPFRSHECSLVTSDEEIVHGIRR